MATDSTTPPNNFETTTPNVPKQQQMSEYKVYVITWNVGTRFPDNISLRNLLDLQNVTASTDGESLLPDIYAMGLQEVNIHPKEQVMGLFKEDAWTLKAKETLRKFDYVAVKTEQMQGLLLTIFVRRVHVPHMRDMEAEFTRTGFGGIWGNKGAVSIRFTLYGCGLSFVVSHLAAHDEHLNERIEDYNQILENHKYHVARFHEIYDHDYVFWFGDLNFRLHGTDSPKEVHNAVKDDKCDELFKRDQLSYIRQKTCKAFHLLDERRPEFPPTFKFHEGTDEYDLKRRPAWTDRILFAMQPINRQPNMPLAIEQTSYKSHPVYNISDHKPVTSDFKIQLYKHFKAPSVKFHDLQKWEIGEENTVEYQLPTEIEEKDRDWIGLFPENYASLNEYVAYEYVNQAETPPTPEDEVDPCFSGPALHRHHHHRNRQRLRRQREDNNEIIRIDFSDDISLKNNEKYVLIYFQSTRGVTSVAGISNTFLAEKHQRPSLHRVPSID